MNLNLSNEELHSLQIVSEEDLVWVEIGVTGVGKSTLGNFLLGKNAFKVGGALVSVTEKAQVDCSAMDGQHLCIVDTPGFCDTRCMGTQNTEAENLSSRDLFSTTKLLDLLDILGNYWNHSILVFTHGKEFDKTNEKKQYETFEEILSSPSCPDV